MLIENDLYPDQNQSQCNSVSVDTRTRWQKFVRRFYYHPRVLKLPGEDLGFELGNGTVTRIEVGSTFNFWERIAFLFSGCIKVEVLVVTENPIGKFVIRAQSYVCTRDDLKGIHQYVNTGSQSISKPEESPSSVD